MGTWIKAAVLVAAAALYGCRSYDTDPREPPDQPTEQSTEEPNAQPEEPGTGGSGSGNTNDAANTDPEMNRGEDLDKQFDPSAVVR